MSNLDFVAIEGTISPPRSSATGKILLGLTGGIAVALSAICVPFVSPALRRFCLPYIPATDTQLRNLKEALKGRTGSLLDLGSGDGRIVITMAEEGTLRPCHGVELNLWLVLYSRIEAWRKGLSSNTRFQRADLWRCDFRKYDNIVVFGVEQMMLDLEKKFNEECDLGCVVAACRFPLPGRKAIRSVGHGIDTVWLYSFNKVD